MILLTGATGYVGRSLLEGLLAQGCSVVTAGRSAPPGDRVRHRDFCLFDEVIRPELFDDVDAVVHCAGLAHERGGDYEEINTRGSDRLARAALAQGVLRFVYISSLNVVPPSAKNPCAPAIDYPPPDTAYALSKWQAEQQLVRVFGGSSVELSVVRPALVYDSALTANLQGLQRLLRSWPVRLPDTGARPMIARPDLVELLAGIMRRPATSGRISRIAALDGEVYTARRIGSALSPKASFTPPELVFRGAGSLRDLITGRPAGSTWRSIAGQHWVGEAPFLEGWCPRFTLESLLGAGEQP